VERTASARHTEELQRTMREEAHLEWTLHRRQAPSNTGELEEMIELRVALGEGAQLVDRRIRQRIERGAEGVELRCREPTLGQPLPQIAASRASRPATRVADREEGVEHLVEPAPVPRGVDDDRGYGLAHDSGVRQPDEAHGAKDVDRLRGRHREAGATK